MSNKKEIKKKSTRDWKPIIVYIATQVGGAIIASIVLAVIAVMNIPEGAEFTSVNDFVSWDTTMMISVISSLCATAIAAIILFCMYRKKLVADFKRITPKQWGLLTLGGIAILVLNIASASFAQYVLGASYDNNDLILGAMSSLPILMAINVIIFAPITEELVFRYSLSTLIKNRIAFIIVSSVIFAFLHATNLAIITYIVMGLGFVIGYTKTKDNVVASMYLHVINNLVAAASMIMLMMGL